MEQKESIIDIAYKYAVDCHNGTNHLYDNTKPYTYHLSMVVDIAKQFIHLIPEADRDNVIAACWLHDTIEDCRQTYNDVKSKTNTQVAEIVYALTNEKGKNRSERGNDKYYHGITHTPFASFVKLCDRAANFKYSVDNFSRMAAMYVKEMDSFISKVDVGGIYEPLIDYLKEISKHYTMSDAKIVKS